MKMELGLHWKATSSDVSNIPDSAINNNTFDSTLLSTSRHYSSKAGVI